MRPTRSWPLVTLPVPYATLLLVIGLLAVSCSEPPHKELSQARGAIDAARAAGAPEHAPDAYQAARESLERAETLAGERDYRQALNLALDASERAHDAARQAADVQAQTRGDAEQALEDVQSHLEAARRQLDAAQEAELSAQTVHPLAEAVAAAEEIMQEARSAIDHQDLAGMIEQLNGVSATLQAALDEVNRTLGEGGSSR